MALGALLSAALPVPRALPVFIQLVALGLIALMRIVSTPLIVIVALLGALVWWRLPDGVRHAIRYRR